MLEGSWKKSWNFLYVWLPKSHVDDKLYVYNDAVIDNVFSSTVSPIPSLVIMSDCDRIVNGGAQQRMTNLLCLPIWLIKLPVVVAK